MALKNKYNNEKDFLDKEVQIMKDEINQEEVSNKQRNHKIEIMKGEFENIKKEYNEYKEATVKQMKDLETKYFTEDHTRQILHAEK